MGQSLISTDGTGDRSAGSKCRLPWPVARCAYRPNNTPFALEVKQPAEARLAAALAVSVAEAWASVVSGVSSFVVRQDSTASRFTHFLGACSPKRCQTSSPSITAGDEMASAARTSVFLITAVSPNDGRALVERAVCSLTHSHDGDSKAFRERAIAAFLTRIG